MKISTKRTSALAKRRRRGLALIEVLLCSSIAAMMLTATAVAFRASVGVYRDNTDRNILLSHGRNAMRQLINEMRQADVHGPMNIGVPNAVTLFAAGQVVEVGGIQLLKKQPDADEPGIIPYDATGATFVLLVWQYNSSAKTITRTRSVGTGAATTTTIAKYVSDFKVRMEPALATNIAAGEISFDLMLRGVVTITMQNQDSSGKMIFTQGNGTATERLIDAAVPRRNFSGL